MGSRYGCARSTLLMVGCSVIVSTARRIIEEEKQFLGFNWADLEHMIQESPGAFPQRILKAYAVVKEFNENLMENVK